MDGLKGLTDGKPNVQLQLQPLAAPVVEHRAARQCGEAIGSKVLQLRHS